MSIVFYLFSIKLFIIKSNVIYNCVHFLNFYAYLHNILTYKKCENLISHFLYGIIWNSYVVPLSISLTGISSKEGTSFPSTILSTVSTHFFAIVGQSCCITVSSG